ncbi:MAG: zf-HC2 domain-containing protein [Candidatus Aminicenantes bacterium]
MRCLKIHQIHEYLENQMPAPQKEECEAHLQVCARCRRLFEDRRRFHAASYTLPELKLPENFALQVMAKIKSGESFSAKWFWLSIGSAILVFFLLTGMTLVRFGPLESWIRLMQSFAGMFQQGALTLMKGLKVIMAFFQAAAGFINLILEKLGSLASLVPPETPFLVIAVFILMTAALILGRSRKSSLGENE